MELQKRAVYSVSTRFSFHALAYRLAFSQTSMPSLPFIHTACLCGHVLVLPSSFLRMGAIQLRDCSVVLGETIVPAVIGIVESCYWSHTNRIHLGDPAGYVPFLIVSPRKAAFASAIMPV